MAKPRIFVSSTYYDLRHIRSSMEGFIESFGYESVLFENGEIPFHHDISLADACYAEVKNCHMLILIVGGRYGSADDERKAKGSQTDIQKMYEAYNSVTRKEYETAREKNMPVFIFVEKGVRAEYETFKSNRANNTVKYAHVDSVNIFTLLDDILKQKRNNFIKEFDRFEDISGWLKEQWAGIFADLLANKREEAVLKDMSDRIAELNQVTSSMKEYTQSIMRKVLPDSEQIINREERKERAGKISRFRQENLIDYILGVTSENNSDARAVELYDSFAKSSTLEEFLNVSGVPESLKSGILTEHIKAARHDYIELKRKYFNEEIVG